MFYYHKFDFKAKRKKFIYDTFVMRKGDDEGFQYDC